MTHTPGPWEHSPQGLQNANRNITVAIPSGYARIIASVKLSDVDDVAANARLIAQAPAMLKVLEAVVSLSGVHRSNMSELPTAVVEDAHAAIAKATEGS